MPNLTMINTMEIIVVMLRKGEIRMGIMKIINMVVIMIIINMMAMMNIIRQGEIWMGRERTSNGKILARRTSY